MKSKYALVFLSAVLLCFSCTTAETEDNPDNNTPDPVPTPTEYSFEACCVDEIVSAELTEEDVIITKSTYAKDIMFKWSSDDRIAMIVKNAQGEKKMIGLSTTTAGTMSTFSAPIEEGWEATGLFFFPYNENFIGYSQDMFGVGKFTYLFPQRSDMCGIEDKVDIPMIGQVADDGVVEFKHACGALKLRFCSLTPGAAYTVLFTSNRYTYGEHTASATFGSCFDHNSVFKYHNDTGDKGSLVIETSVIVSFTANQTGYAEVYMPLAATTHNWHRIELYDAAGKPAYNSKSQNANFQTANNTIVIMPVVDLAKADLNLNYDHIL